MVPYDKPYVISSTVTTSLLYHFWGIIA